MPKVWRILPHDESRVRQLSTQLGITPLTAQVLVARGFAAHEPAAEFLNAGLAGLHDPEQLPGVAEAADRIVSARKAGRRITIYGDYDVDGVTATSLLWHCLKLAGAHVDYYIPCRLEEGYGLNCSALSRLHEEDPRRLVVSVDCGISSIEEAELARRLGLELIVTDHHQYDRQLPGASCLVHPRLPGSDYPFGDLCGVGVAFKLAWAICQRLGDGKKASPQMREFLKSAVGLTAIGTVADVVPLLGENRVIVRYGLMSLVELAGPGMKALMTVCGLNGQRELDAENIGFAIAPRLNAAGRLGQARLAVELLTTDSPQRAAVLAEYLDQLNKNRQTVERRIFKQAKELVSQHPQWQDQPALVLSMHDWHVGVIGIVASRIAEHYEKPTFLISLSADGGTAQGSGRSFLGCDLHAGLAACGEHLQSFGGHQAAAGLTIDANRIDGFREEFCRWVETNRRGESPQQELQIDAEVRLADVTRKAVSELERLGPFGQGNPRPLFVASRVDLAEPPRRMGDGERHLSIRVRQYGGTAIRAIAFGKGEWADPLARTNGPLAISFAPGINRFRGIERVELQLKDWQADSGESTPRSAAGRTSGE